MYCAGSAAHSQQLTVRRHLKGLTVGGTRLPGPIPAHLPNLARHHVVGEEVGVVLRAHQELPAVGREAGTLDGKVLKVDRLDLGVGLAVHQEEGGGSVEPGHQPHCAAGVELGRPDDGALAAALLTISSVDNIFCDKIPTRSEEKSVSRAN